MAIEGVNSEVAINQIVENESKGFKPSTIETELPESETPYKGTANGLYKVIPYTNAAGKGLLVLACATIEFGGKTVEVDLPITKSKVGMFNADMEIGFSVTRKTPNDPKRVKFLGVFEDATVNS